MDEKGVKEIREAGIVIEMRWTDAWVRSQENGRVDKVKKEQ